MSLFHPFKLRNSIVLTSALLAVLLLSGCGITGSIQSATDKAVAVLDRAITELAVANADWQEILNDALEELPDELQSTIGFEVSRTLERAIGASGSEVKCIVDFLHDRVREDLIRIKARLLKETIPPLMPVFCAVESVDMAKVMPKDGEQRQNNLLIHGYNFDIENPVQIVLLERTQGQGPLDDIINDVPDLDPVSERRFQLREGLREVNVNEHLFVKTHYEMELNLGRDGVPLSSNSQSFSIRWQGREMSRTPIIQPLLPACEIKGFQFIPPNPITFTPPFTEGLNKDFDGEGPHVQVKVYIVSRDLRTFGVEIFMHAVQAGEEAIGGGVIPRTTASGRMRIENLFTIDQGYALYETITPSSNGVEYTDNDRDDDTLSPTSFGPAQSFKIVGDTDGDEAGTQTKVTVTLNTIEFRIRQVEDCR